MSMLLGYHSDAAQLLQHCCSAVATTLHSQNSFAQLHLPWVTDDQPRHSRAQRYCTPQVDTSSIQAEVSQADSLPNASLPQ